MGRNQTQGRREHNPSWWSRRLSPNRNRHVRHATAPPTASRHRATAAKDRSPLLATRTPPWRAAGRGTAKLKMRWRCWVRQAPAQQPKRCPEGSRVAPRRIEQRLQE
eukprot:scaffold66049_cov28-Tisochrysis_lutea.AAC.4